MLQGYSVGLGLVMYMSMSFCREMVSCGFSVAAQDWSSMFSFASKFLSNLRKSTQFLSMSLSNLVDTSFMAGWDNFNMFDASHRNVNGT